MTFEIISKESTIKTIKESLGSKLKNKELFNEIYTLFMKVINANKIKFNTAYSEIEVTDLTKKNGNSIKFEFEPDKINFDSVKIYFQRGPLYKKNYTINFTNHNSITINIEESEFLFENGQLKGMILSKKTKQYTNDILEFAHEYSSKTLTGSNNISSSSDMLIQTDHNNIGNKRLVQIKDDGSFEIKYFLSNNMQDETFNTIDNQSQGATFKECTKDQFEKILNKKNGF